MRLHIKARSAVCFLLFLVAVRPLPSPAKGVPDLFGIVFNSRDIGVPALLIRLTPPDQSASPAFTTTDNRGAFQFLKLPGRLYVLDVIGPDRKTLLNRSSVDLQKQKRVVIKLFQIP